MYHGIIGVVMMYHEYHDLIHACMIQVMIFMIILIVMIHAYHDTSHIAIIIIIIRISFYYSLYICGAR